MLTSAVLVSLSVLMTKESRIEAAPFPSQVVRITGGPFLAAQQADAKYLLELDPYRLLHNVYVHSGLPTHGDAYGGWEQQGVATHTLGHYISACSHMYAATGDDRFKQRVDTIVGELDKCQKVRPDGFITGIPDADKVFAEVRKGDIRSAGFDLNGSWVPWYTIHKLFAGLIDASQEAGNPDALRIAAKLGDWAIWETEPLNPDQWQTMLACEHGGMNDALANLSALTGQTKYLTLAEKFYHKTVLDPLAAEKPDLEGRHGNTQIPKVIGAARIFELTGEPKYKTIAEFFWKEVTDDHTYVTGGNTMGEHFGAPGKLNDRLGTNTTETCNTYNMLKLTEHLFSWHPTAALGDYYERAVYNHILATQDRDDGQLCYFMPLESGHTKPFGTPFNDFTCCYGTGMENHGRYGHALYFHDQEDLWINLYAPSTLDWAEKGLQLTANTEFPADGQVHYSFKLGQPQKLRIYLRYPHWATTCGMKVNGKEMPVKTGPGSFFGIERVWQDGDRLDIDLGMCLRTEAMPDNPQKVAFFYGPTLLAGTIPGDGGPAPVTLESTPLPQSLKPTGQPLTFESTEVKPTNLTFIPFYQVQNQRYAVYFDVFSQDGWQKKEAEYREEEKAKEALEKATLDFFQPGEMQPERDHNLQSEKSDFGSNGGRKWRHASDGGYFEWTMKVDPAADNELRLTYWGSDADHRTFTILIDGQKLADQTLNRNKPEKFYDQPYRLSKQFLNGRTQITIRLQSQPGTIAGGLYGARTIKMG